MEFSALRLQKRWLLFGLSVQQNLPTRSFGLKLVVFTITMLGQTPTETSNPCLQQVIATTKDKQSEGIYATRGCPHFLYVHGKIRDMQNSFKREVASVVLKALTVVLTIILVIVSVSFIYSDAETAISDGECNVAVFPLEGTILPFYGLIDTPLVVTPAMAESFIKNAEEDSSIKAILLEINSPGGTPVASQRIAERIQSSTLPVVGLIGDIGASGGYMVAAATNYLIASTMSDIGSIGVNMSYVEESEKNKEDGLTYVQLTTGKFKDAGSSNRPITAEERELFQRDLDIVHNEFIDLVALYRDLPREEVEKLADGSTMTGKRALENKLIDGVGGRKEARESLAAILGIETAEVVFCEYESPLQLF